MSVTCVGTLSGQRHAPLLHQYMTLTADVRVNSAKGMLIKQLRKSTHCVYVTYLHTTAGSPMIGTPIILVPGPTSLGLIKDLRK